MINVINKKIIQFLIKNNSIKEEEIYIYFYCIEVFLSILINLIAIFFMAFVSHQIINSITFVIVFKLMRQHISGYHANTQIKCVCIFISLFLIYLYAIMNYSETTKILIAFYMLLTSILVVVKNTNPFCYLIYKSNQIYPLILLIFFVYLIFWQINSDFCFTISYIQLIVVLSGTTAFIK